MTDAHLLRDLAELLTALALADIDRTTKPPRLVLDDRLRDAMGAIDLHGTSLQIEEAARGERLQGLVFGTGGGR